MVGRFINSDSFDVITLSPTELYDKNLFAYCDNNPIDRADDGGEFWHIVAGAAVGGIVEAVSTALDGGNVYEILISLGCGAVAGGVSAACPAASVAINAAMGAVQSVACNLVDGKKDTAIGMVTEATISAGFGALSGSSGPSCLADPTLYKTGKQLRNVAKKGYRPLVRKEAKKTYKALVKNTTKQFGKEMVETGAYKSIEWYTKKRVETLYKKIG